MPHHVVDNIARTNSCHGASWACAAFAKRRCTLNAEQRCCLHASDALYSIQAPTPSFATHVNATIKSALVEILLRLANWSITLRGSAEFKNGRRSQHSNECEPAREQLPMIANPMRISATICHGLSAWQKAAQPLPSAPLHLSYTTHTCRHGAGGYRSYSRMSTAEQREHSRINIKYSVAASGAA